MNERNRASSELLAELGWLTIQWARLEAYVDLLSAYVAHQQGIGPVPRPFNARVRFLRTALLHPALINLRGDGERLLERIMPLSRKRNDLIHGIVVSWSEGEGMSQTLLRSTDSASVAIQDIPLKISDFKMLSSEFQQASAKLFGLLERMKSIYRLVAGEEGFHHVSRLRGDRD